MNIIFKWVKYQNIMSVGAKPIYVELEEFNKTLVTGHNGAGKSTFIEALTFLLYGKAFRNINKPLLINTYNKKNLLVEGELLVGNDLYNIKRGMKPTVLEITKNGEPLKDVASSPEYQEYFENQLLGINYSSFKQIIVLGTAGYTPFMQLPSGKRRELVEDLLNVSVLGDMDKLNKSEIKQTKIEIDLSKTKLEGLEREKQSINNMIDSQKNANNRMIDSLTDDFKNTVANAKNIKLEIDNIIDPIEPSFDPYQTKIDSLDTKYDINSLRVLLQKTKQDEIDQLTVLENNKANLLQKIPEIDKEEIDKLNNSILSDDDIDVKLSDVKLPYLYVTKPDDFIPIGDINKLSSELKLLNDKIFDIKLKINKNNDKISFYENGGECPTCGRDCTSDNHSQIYIDDNLLLNTELDNINNVKSEIQNKIDLINKQEFDHKQLVDEYNNAYANYQTNMVLYESEIVRYKSELIKFNNDLINKIEFIKNDYNNRLNQYNNTLIVLDNDIEKLKSGFNFTLNRIQNDIDSIDVKKSNEINLINNEYQSVINNYKNQLENNKNLIKAKTELYDSVVLSAKNLKTKIDDLKSVEYDYSKIDSLDVDINDLKNNIGSMIRKNHARGIIGDMLKDNGIKSHIVKKYIPIFNKKINNYLKILGADYIFNLDENFEETIKSRGREEFSYYSFSEGEKARINISLMFTWRDISSIVSGTNINLLCLDEVFDGSCDDTGIEGINSILDGMDSNIFIISHRKDAFDESFDRHIKMVKQGRFAVMQE